MRSENTCICPLNEGEPRINIRETIKANSPVTPLNRQVFFTPDFKTFVVMLVVVSTSLMLPPTGQASFLDKTLDFGKDLLGKAALNYTNKYEQKLTKLLQSLRQPNAADQPFIQGIIPSTPYNPNGFGDPNPVDPNTPYGATDSANGIPYGGDPYGQQPASGQNNPQDGYYGQQETYPPDPNYGGYSPTDQQGGGYGQYPNQGYPAHPNYGNEPFATPNPYGQPLPGQLPYDPNLGTSGYPSSPYPSQGGQDPYNQYESYQGQPTSPAPQGGYDPRQPQNTYAPQSPTYAQPVTPLYPTLPTVKPPEISTAQSPRGDGLQLDVALLKKMVVNGAETLLPLHDGDILTDGRGNSKTGDKFRVMFRANTDCYIYVIAIDGSAWAQGIFPTLTSPFANPVKSGQQYILPEGNNWFSLDQFQGIETVFFVASSEKRQDIEDILGSIAGRERPPMAKPHPVTEVPIIPAGFSHRQQSTTPFIIGQDHASAQSLLPTTYFTQQAGEALRVTRWFRHQ